MVCSIPITISANSASRNLHSSQHSKSTKELTQEKSLTNAPTANPHLLKYRISTVTIRITLKISHLHAKFAAKTLPHHLTSNNI
jgi:hypothetical protein